MVRLEIFDDDVAAVLEIFDNDFASGLEIFDDVASNRHVRTRPSRVEPRRGSTRVVRSAHRARASGDLGIVFGTLFVFEKLLEDGKDLS